MDAGLGERRARHARLRAGARRRARARRCSSTSRAASTRSNASPRPRHTPCIFEYVYFARPDSIIDNISVYKARLRMGERLAEKIKRERPDHDIDVVIPIPDTSRTSAVQVAQLLGVKYREGFIKNRYIGRTFIMPGQEQRSKSVRSKLNAIDLEFRGKNVLLVDDSIVRGTTSAQIIDMAREAGAKKVYFASAAPPVRYPERLRHRHAGHLRAGRRGPHGRRSARASSAPIGSSTRISRTWCMRCGTTTPRSRISTPRASPGEYVTGDVTPEYLARLQRRALRRGQAAASRRAPAAASRRSAIL